MREGHCAGLHWKMTQAQENRKKWENKILHFVLGMDQCFSPKVYWFYIYHNFAMDEQKLLKAEEI